MIMKRAHTTKYPITTVALTMVLIMMLKLFTLHTHAYSHHQTNHNFFSTMLYKQ
jgi:hypothetical protein